MRALGEQIRTLGLSLGFSMVGIAPARPSPQLEAYLAWIGAGMHGTMDYMAREDRIARRRDPALILPGARSLIMVTMDYGGAEPPEVSTDDPARGRISNYAWGADYHRVMLQRLRSLIRCLRDEIGPGMVARAYVDTGAILERSHAQEASLGFIGRNTMLIHPRRGSYFFIGEIITSMDIDCGDAGTEQMPGCGTCTRCLSACPTGALVAPYVLDARRCISYLTIEHRGFIPRELRPLMGNRVYGCDTCQEVCPWQRFAGRGQPEVAFRPSAPDRVAPLLSDLLGLTEETFAALFRGSAIYRIGRARMVRNACIAAGNSGIRELAACLIPLLHDTSPLVRGHAAWALGRLDEGRQALRSALSHETDETVRLEIALALDAA